MFLIFLSPISIAPSPPAIATKRDRNDTGKFNGRGHGDSRCEVEICMLVRGLHGSRGEAAAILQILRPPCYSCSATPFSLYGRPWFLPLGPCLISRQRISSHCCSILCFMSAATSSDETTWDAAGSGGCKRGVEPAWTAGLRCVSWCRLPCIVDLTPVCIVLSWCFLFLFLPIVLRHYEWTGNQAQDG
jgi:hypothetical protein